MTTTTSLRNAFLIILCLGLLIVAPAVQATAQTYPAQVNQPSNTGSLDDPADLAAFFDGFINAQLAAYHFPGAQVAIVRGDQVLFLKGYGYADLERRIPVDAERTLFRPGSVSKLFTWTAVMQLVEQGKLDLDADVNTYLTDFKIPASFSQPITLRHLMTHTPGFEDKGIGIFVMDFASLKPLGEYLANNMPKRVFPPGQVCAYSNYGASLAGYIVAQVSGQPFEGYIADHILAPLGMLHSTFAQPLPAGLQPDLAVGYSYINGTFKPQPAEAVQVIPAGSLSATAGDIARFMIAHLQNGRYGNVRILEDATAQEMHSHQYSTAPGLSGMALGFIENRIDGQRLITHGGDTSTFHSLLALDLERQVGLYVSYNGTGTGSASLDARTDLLVAFLERYLSFQPAAQPTPKAEFAAQAARFAGAYYPARSNFTTPEKILNLLTPVQVSLPKPGTLLISYSIIKIPAVQIGPNEFQQVGGERQRIVFLEDPTGQVTGMTVENLSVMEFLKTPWYGNPLLHQLLLLVCLLIFLIGLVSWPRRLWADRRALAPSAPRSARLALWAGFIMAFLNLVFIVGTAIIFMQLMSAPVAIPPGLKVLMWLPVLTAVLALAMLVFCALAWRGRWWKAGTRFFYTLGALAGLGFIAFVAYWNLWAI
jgi:CubicO group peptidase (beta-lactamase class C family)